MKSYYDDAQTPSQDIHSTPTRNIHSFTSKPSREVKETVMSHDPATLDVRYEVAYKIGEGVPEVQALFTQLEGRFLRVWTVVPERDDAIYRKVYAQQKEVMKAFDGLEFEFNVIPSLGRPPRETVPDPGCSLVFQR